MGVAIAIALGLTATGCAKATPQEQMQAAIEARCKSGKGPCPNRERLQTTIECQAGDAAACQHLAVAGCESGDRLACQSLAVTYRELKPLCDKGNAPACHGMNLEWPSSAKWNPEQEIAQAESDCRAGKRASCRALRTHAQVFGGRIIWTQSYVAPRNH